MGRHSPVDRFAEDLRKAAKAAMTRHPDGKGERKTYLLLASKIPGLSMEGANRQAVIDWRERNRPRILREMSANNSRTKAVSATADLARQRWETTEAWTKRLQAVQLADEIGKRRKE